MVQRLTALPERKWAGIVKFKLENLLRLLYNSNSPKNFGFVTIKGEYLTWK